MKTRRPSSSTVVRSLLGGVLGGLFLATPAFAQAISTFTIQVAGTVGIPVAAVAGALETVSFSGPLRIRATVVTDPAGGPPSVVVSIDARGVAGKGLSTGMVYVNSGQANLTRRFAATDQIKTTFAFHPSTAGGFMQARTALATLNLTYNTTTQALTGATGSIGNP